VLLVLCFFFISSEVFSETVGTYHLHLSEGVTHLNKDDLDGAMQRFQQALAENPKGVEAHYYIGVTKTRNHKIEEAKRSFQDALSIDRTFIPAHFDLGVLYYQSGQDNLALEAFKTVEKIDPGRARVYYYQALILKRQGKTEEMESKMERAVALDPDLALGATFETGVAFYQAGDLEGARKLFQDVMTSFPESDMAQSAVEFLDTIDHNKTWERPWDMTLSVGIQYDDNVILESTQNPTVGQTIIDKKDPLELSYARGRYRWLNAPTWTGNAEYRFYQNYHADAALNGFNALDHHLLLNGGGQIGRNKWIVQYELQYLQFGGERYMIRQGVSPRFSLMQSKNNLTEFLYEFGVKRFSNIDGLFPSNTDRGADVHRIGFTHYSLSKSNVNLSGGYFFEREIAGTSLQEDDWTFGGHRLVAAWAPPPWHRMRLALDAEFILRNFSNKNESPPFEKRKDTELFSTVTLSRAISKQVDLSVQYLHQQNSSNIPLYDYRRNIYGIIATFKAF